MPFLDLRKELVEMLDKHGWWAVLRRRFGTKKQEPFDTTTDEAIPKKDSALASGENYLDEFVRVRSTSLMDTVETSSSLGREAAALMRFYLRHHTKPDVHDFLIELAQDESSLARSRQLQPLVPYKIAKVWDIQEVHAMRDQGGRIEFWQVFVREATAGDM